MELFDAVLAVGMLLMACGLLFTAATRFPAKGEEHRPDQV
jgi:hypothetical protein